MFYRSYITLIIISQFYFHLTVLLAFHILNITSWCLYCFITPLSRTEQTNICWCAVKILLAQHHTTQSWVYFPFLSMSSSSFQSHSPVCYSRCPVVSCLDDPDESTVRPLTYAPETSSRNRCHMPKFDARFRRQFVVPMHGTRRQSTTLEVVHRHEKMESRIEFTVLTSWVGFWSVCQGPNDCLLILLLDFVSVWPTS